MTKINNSNKFIEFYKYLSIVLEDLRKEVEWVSLETSKSYAALQPYLELENLDKKEGLTHLLNFCHYAQISKKTYLDSAKAIEKLIKSLKSSLDANMPNSERCLNSFSDFVIEYNLGLDEEIKKIEACFSDYNIKINLEGAIN